MIRISAVILFCFLVCKIGYSQGTLILTGGDFVPEAIHRFVKSAGGENARIVYIPTGASQLRLPSGFIHDPDSVQNNVAFAAELTKIFEVKNITVLHTRDRKIANSKDFVAPLDNADGVWLGAGNSGRIAETYLNTLVHKKLTALLDAGKVIGGHSAGAIIQGSFIVRGRYDKPLLMPKGKTEGFGFLTNVVVNAHIISAKRENELIDVLDANNNLLGIGLDDNSVIVVSNNILEVIGPGKVAIYENIKRENGWYYWLTTGDKFNISLRRKE